MTYNNPQIKSTKVDSKHALPPHVYRTSDTARERPSMTTTDSHVNLGKTRAQILFIKTNPIKAITEFTIMLSFVFIANNNPTAASFSISCLLLQNAESLLCCKQQRGRCTKVFYIAVIEMSISR